MTIDPTSSDPPATEPRGSTTGGLPPDFFEAAPSLPPERTIAAVGPADGALPPRTAKPTHRPSQGASDRRTSLPVILVVLVGNVVFFLAGGLAGWAVARKVVQPAQPRAGAPDPLLNELARTVDTKASQHELSGLESNMGKLQSELAALSRELARVEARLDAKPSAPAAAPDLSPLTTKIDDMATVGRKLAPLPAALQTLREHVESLDQRLDALSADVAGFPKQVETALVPVKDQLAARPASEKVSSSEGARRLGAELFREGKFLAAREVFLRLAEDEPDDARLWYFAALSSGLTSGDWRGETERMVLRGVDREKAGTPARAEIDAQFASVKPEQAKQWLDAWRQRARER